MRKIFMIILLVGILGGRSTVNAQVAPFQKQTLISNLVLPTAAAFLPDGRMLITQLEGGVLITSPISQLPISTTPYLTLPNVDYSAEHGLVEVVLDPNFAVNNFIYLYYSTLSNRLRLSRFVHQVDSAQLSSEVVIWESHDVYSGCCHTGGAVSFFPDGTILLSVGDDFSPQLAQQLGNSFGKVHRINPDGSIPVDNPFYDQTPGLFNLSGVLKSIYAYGFRNPFRGSFDLSGRFLIGVVGGNDHTVAWEDLVSVEAGGNYGWPFCGDAGRDVNGLCNDPQYIDALMSYPHAGTGAAITAGVTYQGSAYPAAYNGRFFYADYARWTINCLEFDANGAVVSNTPFMDTTLVGGEPAKAVVKILEGPDGALYYVSIFDDFVNFKGSISKIIYVDDLPPVCQSVSVVPSSGPGPTMEVDFAAVAVDPEGLPVTYEWYFGDGSPSVQNDSATHTYTSTGIYYAELVVSDTTSSVSCGVYPVTVGVPPSIAIVSPVQGSLFNAATIVTFEAVYSDDGPVSDADLEWNIRFNHDAHIHPNTTGSGTADFDFVIPHYGHDFSGNSWFTATVTITDADGLTASHSVEIFPNKVDVTITSDPPGLELIVSGQPQTTPFTTDHAVGMELLLSAATGSQCLNDTGYMFQQWNIGAPPTIFYYVPNANDTVIANFTEQGSCELCGYALSFDGVNDLLTLPTISLAVDITVEAWIKPEMFLTSADVIFSGGVDQALDLDGGKLRLIHGVDTLIGSIAIQEQVWQHIAVVRSGGIWEFYVNGVLDASLSGTGTLMPIGISRIGKGFGPAGFHGDIDEFRIWQQALSGVELQANMVAQIDPATAGLMVYLRMDQQPGLQSIRDGTGNGYNAVLGSSKLAGSDDPTGMASSGPMSLICERVTELTAMAWLQGPFDINSILMHDSLRRRGMIPMLEPYSVLQLHLGPGGQTIDPSVLQTAGPNAIVDWVLLELRDADDPQQIISTHTALIQRDGDIVGLNGIDALELTIDRPYYYVALRHRNHLGVMTNGPISFSSSPTLVDLTQPAANLHGNEAGVVVGGNLLLWAGNVNLDQQLKYAGKNNDRDPILVQIGGGTPTNVVSGYFNEDVNMDGDVKYSGVNNDRDTILVNIGGSVPTSTRQQQLP